nr:hypothetical protein [Sulfurospirillum sp. 'SP']
MIFDIKNYSFFYDEPWGVVRSISNLPLVSEILHFTVDDVKIFLDNVGEFYYVVPRFYADNIPCVIQPRYIPELLYRLHSSSFGLFLYSEVLRFNTFNVHTYEKVEYDKYHLFDRTLQVVIFSSDSLEECLDYYASIFYTTRSFFQIEKYSKVTSVSTSYNVFSLLGFLFSTPCCQLDFSPIVRLLGGTPA